MIWSSIFTRWFSLPPSVSAEDLANIRLVSATCKHCCTFSRMQPLVVCCCQCNVQAASVSSEHMLLCTFSSQSCPGQVYLILDEFIMGGEIQETSKKVHTRPCTGMCPSLRPFRRKMHCLPYSVTQNDACEEAISLSSLTMGTPIVWHARQGCHCMSVKGTCLRCCIG